MLYFFVIRLNFVALSTTVARQRKTIAELRRKIQLQRRDTAASKFSVKNVRDSSIPGLFKFYTGFTFAIFMTIFSCLVPNENSVPFHYSRKNVRLNGLSLVDQLFLVLCRLRNAFTLKDLSFRFGLTPQGTSIICSSWLNYMFFHFSSVSIWPHRDIICSKMPPKFKSHFPDTMAIIDATELKIQKPNSLLCQSEFLRLQVK